MENSLKFIFDEQGQVPLKTIRVLEQMSGVPGVKKPIVVLPDLHFKSSYHTPTGVVVLVRDRMVPKFVNPNCGMTFIVTPFFEKDITDNALDAVFAYLKRHISVSTWLKPVIAKSDLEDIVKNGALWVFKKYGLVAEDINNFENKGSLFKDENISPQEILSHIPQASQDIGLHSIGVLGFGNHFIEMQKAEEIISEDIARKFNIAQGQICFMLHGDSREFGRSIFDFNSRKAKKLFGLQQLYKKAHFLVLSSRRTPLWAKRLLGRINYYGNRIKSSVYWKLRFLKTGSATKFPFIEKNSAEGRRYRIGSYAALNFAYANRAYMAVIIRDALQNALRKEKVDIRVLFDGSHDSLQEEVIDGENYWVHRNGASRALPPRFYKNHPIFSVTGQPVLLPSSLGNPSFLCAATKGCQESYYSSSHGTGRLIDRGEARRRFKKQDVLNEIALSKVRVYDYGDGCISEESPRAFKNVLDIIRIIEKNNIAVRVIKLAPIAVLKGWV